MEVDWTVTTPSVIAAPDGPGEQRQGTPAACAAAGSTEAGRGTTGYYMERPARTEFSVLRGHSPGREDWTPYSRDGPFILTGLIAGLRWGESAALRVSLSDGSVYAGGKPTR